MALTLDKAFNPRHNSIGFLRWFLAFAVIFSHAGPLGGFYNSRNLGNQWTDQQSFGGVAVEGFFFLSGFLITKSRMGRSTIFRYFWRRVLRIFPAFWAALLLTALVLAPIAWWGTRGTLSGYFSATNESPWTYLLDNMWLKLNQLNIAGMGEGTPLAACCTADWNGSAWTLYHEFKGYILIGLFGLFGVLANRIVATMAFSIMLLANTLLFAKVTADYSALSPIMSNFYDVMLLTPFLFGMMFALWGDKIPVDDRLAIAAGSIAFFTFFIAYGWQLYGQFAFLYLLMWCAVRLRLQNWEKHGDLSYGIYIYAWPLQQFMAHFHVERLGWVGYHLVIAVAVHVAAYLSWHLLEKRALSLKNWTPGWLRRILEKLAPISDRVKRKIVNPEYSSTHFARKLSADAAAAAAERRDDSLVTHEIADRIQPVEASSDGGTDHQHPRDTVSTGAADPHRRPPPGA